MFCQKCGNKLDDNAKFCTRCGTPTSISLNEVKNSENKSSRNTSSPLDTDTEDYIYIPPKRPVSIEKNTEVHADDKSQTSDFTEISSSGSQLSDNNHDFTEQSAEIKSDNADSFNNVQASAVNDTMHEQSSADFSDSSSTVIQDDTHINEYSSTQSADNGNSYNTDFPEEYSEVMPVEEDTPTNVSRGRRFGASVLVVFSIIFMVLLNTAVSVRFSINGNSVQKSFNKIKINALMDAETDNGKSVVSYIYDQLDDNLKNNYGVEEKHLRNFMEESDIQSFTAETLGKYADMVLLGKGKASLTAEDISDFVRNNADIIEADLGYTVKESDYIEIESQFDDTEESKYLTPSNWKSEFGFDFRNTYIVIYVIIGVSAVLTVLIMIWQAVILRKKGRYITGRYGTSFLISGLISAITAIALFLMSVSSSCPLMITGKLLMPSVKLFSLIGCIELLIGIIFISVSRKLRQKA